MSRTVFEASDLTSAAKQLSHAFPIAIDSFEIIAAKQPLEHDKDDVKRNFGDLLFGRPNFVTDNNASEFFPPEGSWMQFDQSRNRCWDELVKWSEGAGFGSKPLLLSYGAWLARQRGQAELLQSKCDVLAAKLESFRATRIVQDAS